MWIADLLALGLIRSSFVQPAPIQELRDLTRTRKQLVREMARHTQRIQKTLEDANIKLTEVVSDILGVSGRAILLTLVAGETDPERLAGSRMSGATVGRPMRGPVERHRQCEAIRRRCQQTTGRGLHDVHRLAPARPDP